MEPPPMTRLAKGDHRHQEYGMSDLPMTETLKPCPFCNDDDAMSFFDDIDDPDYRGWKVECGGCAAKSGTFANEDFAIRAWNRRP